MQEKVNQLPGLIVGVLSFCCGFFLTDIVIEPLVRVISSLLDAAQSSFVNSQTETASQTVFQAVVPFKCLDRCIERGKVCIAPDVQYRMFLWEKH